MKIKSQPRIKGVIRQRISASVQPAIERALRAEARRYGVSKSWVQTVALGEALGIDVLGYHEAKASPAAGRGRKLHLLRKTG